jgi:hypothetical protein
MTSHKVLALVVIASTFSLGVEAGFASTSQSIKSGKACKLKVKKVRQEDGSVMLRLAVPEAGQGKSGIKSRALQPSAEARRLPIYLAMKGSQLPDEWLEALAEPRLMIALATVAVEPGTAAKLAKNALDPSSARNWNEFSEISPYMRGLASGMDPKAYQAIFNESANPRTTLRRVNHPLGIAIPDSFQAGIPLPSTIWSKAFGDGPGGVDAAKEWLKLPMPDPGFNPWLDLYANYRY